MINCLDPLKQEPSNVRHDDFLPLYPVIQRHASVVFRHLPAVEREEAIANAVAAGFENFVQLKKSGKNPAEFSSTMADFAARCVSVGRHVGSRFSSRDVLSKAARMSRGFSLCSLSTRGQRRDEFLTDDSTTPILDQVCFRIDWAAFLSTLTWRHRRMVHALAIGHSSKCVARKFDVSQSRISQLRSHWRHLWLAFLGEVVADAAPANSY